MNMTAIRQELEATLNQLKAARDTQAHDEVNTLGEHASVLFRGILKLVVDEGVSTGEEGLDDAIRKFGFLGYIGYYATHRASESVASG